MYLSLQISYFVTELLGTDLSRLLVSRSQPLEKQFVQYFLYQILVGITCSQSIRQLKLINSSGVSNMFTLLVLFTAIS